MPPAVSCRLGYSCNRRFALLLSKLSLDNSPRFRSVSQLIAGCWRLAAYQSESPRPAGRCAGGD
ncbi:MAG: hypothetical protein AB2693_07435 [Candidatus Thiodiazotropha sp.]